MYHTSVDRRGRRTADNKKTENRRLRQQEV